MNKKNKKPACRRGRVICAMSGGVDSSITAAILKKKGYDVVGIFMRMHQYSKPDDARKIAKELNIPFEVLDIRKEFKKRVVDYLIEEYKKGRTPNPCVECNRWIKFKFSNMATGHYARIKNGKLFVAKDRQKDQSYFLWTLTQRQLKKILFPVGDYTKEQVRGLAKKWGLPVFEKRDSQEICFIPDADIRGFLKSRIHAERGPIITIDSKKVGEHEGLAFYTIGQRKGIKIGGIGPFYVVDKDFKNNALIVAKSEHVPELYEKEMTVEKVNWILGKKPKLPIKCRVKIRYLHPANPAKIMKKSGKNLKIIFNKKQRAITSGQSAVFYLKDEVLGGGIIQ